MYGSESWVVNVTLLKSLKPRLGNAYCGSPSTPQTTSHCSCLDGHLYMCARILCSKISFLFRTCSDDDGSSLRAETFTTIAATDVNPLSIVKQCIFLQSSFPSLSNLTDEVLCKSQELSLRSLKEKILQADRTRTLAISIEHPSLLYPFKIAEANRWLKFWDMSLDHEENGTRAALSILKLLSMTVFSDRKCLVTRRKHFCIQWTSEYWRIVYCKVERIALQVGGCGGMLPQKYFGFWTF